MRTVKLISALKWPTSGGEVAVVLTVLKVLVCRDLMVFAGVDARMQPGNLTQFALHLHLAQPLYRHKRTRIRETEKADEICLCKVLNSGIMASSTREHHMSITWAWVTLTKQNNKMIASANLRRLTSVHLNICNSKREDARVCVNYCRLNVDYVLCV